MAAVVGLAAPSLAWAQAGTVNYVYDALGRLVVANYPDGTCLAYSYDAAGNRTQYTSSTIIGVSAPARSLSTYEAVASTFDPRVGVPTCGSTLTVSAVGTPSHGAASIVSGGTGITYTPSAGYTGTDSFTYQLMAGGVSSPNGTVTLTVLHPTLPPTALNIQASGGNTVASYPYVQTSVTPYVSDPYGYTPTISAVTQGAQGSVTFSGSTLTYSSTVWITKYHSLADDFTYTMTDGYGHNVTATVSVTYSVEPSGGGGNCGQYAC